jgi:hypothetical protein
VVYYFGGKKFRIDERVSSGIKEFKTPLKKSSQLIKKEDTKE